MIKLLDIIKENEEETFNWRSPRDCPHRIVRVYSIIVESLLRRRMVPKKYLLPIIEQSEEGDDGIIRDYWIIWNSVNPKKSLIFYASEDEEGWKLGTNPNDEQYLSPSDLTEIIKTWGENDY